MVDNNHALHTHEALHGFTAIKLCVFFCLGFGGPSASLLWGPWAAAPLAHWVTQDWSSSEWKMLCKGCWLLVEFCSYSVTILYKRFITIVSIIVSLTPLSSSDQIAMFSCHLRCDEREMQFVRVIIYTRHGDIAGRWLWNMIWNTGLHAHVMS